MIIVTGATGQLGSQIVEQLLMRVPVEGVGVSVRDVDRAADLAVRGVRVRRGDYTEPDSLAAAFEDATQVLIVAANTFGRERIAAHSAALNAARDAGAQRVLYTSHQGARSDSLFAPMLDHAATEEHMSRLGIPFTSLRNGYYANSLPWLLGRAIETGEIVAPHDGPVSWTTHADLAEVAATILASQVPIDGITPPLTAPEAHDLADIARTLSELTGRSIRRVVADEAEWARSLTESGVPEGAVRMMTGMYRASHRGEFAATDPVLEDILGRPAESVDTVLREIASKSSTATSR